MVRKISAAVLAIVLLASLSPPFMASAQPARGAPVASLTPIVSEQISKQMADHPGDTPQDRLLRYVVTPPVRRTVPRPWINNRDLPTAPFFQIAGNLTGPDGVNDDFGAKAWSSLTSPEPFPMGVDGAVLFDAWRSGEGLTVSIAFLDHSTVTELPPIEMASGETVRRTLPGGRVLTLTAVIRAPTTQEAALAADFLKRESARLEGITNGQHSNAGTPVPVYPAPPPIAQFVGKAPPPAQARSEVAAVAGPATPLIAIATQDIAPGDSRAAGLILNPLDRTSGLAQIIPPGKTSGPVTPDSPVYQLQGSFILPGGQILPIRNMAGSANNRIVGLGSPSQSLEIRIWRRDEGDLALAISLVYGGKAYAFQPFFMPSGTTSVHTLPDGQTLILSAVTRPQTADEKLASARQADWSLQARQAQAEGRPAPGPLVSFSSGPPPIEDYLLGAPGATTSTAKLDLPRSAPASPREAIALASAASPLAAVMSEDFTPAQARPAGVAALNIQSRSGLARRLPRGVSPAKPPAPGDPAFQVEGLLVLANGQSIKIANTAWTYSSGLVSLGDDPQIRAMTVIAWPQDDGQIGLAICMVYGGKAYAFEPLIMPSGTTTARTLPDGARLVLSAVVRPQTEVEQAASQRYADWTKQVSEARANGQPMPQPPGRLVIFPPIENYMRDGQGLQNASL